MARFRILTVCSGNICRSPIAEQVLRHSLLGTPVVVESAGTIARGGDRMTPQAEALSRQLGGDPEGHVAHELVEHDVRDSELVLAMSREHRRAVVSLFPKASRYTFTIREFARLAAGLTHWDLAEVTAMPGVAVSERLSALVELIASRRGQIDPPESPEDDDVIDPFGQDDATYALAGRQLQPAIDSVLTAFGLALATDRS